MQNETREKLYSLLGDLPDRHRPISARLVGEEERDSYILETLELDLNGEEPVPAYFSRPKNAKAPWPSLLYSHAHGGAYQIGKEELIAGRPALWPVPYAEAMAERGVACLCIDHWCFGERCGREEMHMFKSMLWYGKVLWGMMVYDSLRAMDYLVSRPDVDAQRIGAAGISMGSTLSVWTAALDTRIKTCVELCCLTDYEEMEKDDNIKHGIYYYVPSLRKYFDTADISALIAPRPHLCTAGRYDRATPMDGLERIEAQLNKVYEDMGAKGGFQLNIYPCGHMEPRAMREDILAFFDQTL